MLPRNDGIGGTPRLARNTSIGPPRRTDATPHRPPLPRRTPGETDIGRDPRFRLTAAGAVAPAPCRPLLRPLTILDRWDPGKARRMRAMLRLSGLLPAVRPHREDDDHV
ncbi:hypothetical protein O7632_18125 [Solwaraspora sp. WMMD406]|uniref:hypothetical protein n=1 Tax=Solwaraspora sp. WMMD406 TaxID=3016095 RepID=UPI00241613E2|nr:hypothetical protein [Solwaraspora sp. WMMD406]MDG4766003.1 hypothetical protein [Solwaraspora sp. WMMD406]